MFDAVVAVDVCFFAFDVFDAFVVVVVCLWRLMWLMCVLSLFVLCV